MQLPRSTAKTIGLSFGIFLILAGLGFAWFFFSGRDIACTPYPGSSSYGESKVQLLPPGYTCSWPHITDQQLIDSAKNHNLQLTQKDIDKAKGPHYFIWPYTISVGLAGAYMCIRKPSI